MCNRILALVCLATVLVFLAGCGSGSQEEEARVKVTGKVTLNGKALEKGTISFEGPEDTAKGRGPATGEITGGQYEVEVVPGDKAVQIRSEVETGEVDETGLKLTRNLVPAQYNDNSRLKAKVTAEGPNTFDFPLKTR